MMINRIYNIVLISIIVLFIGCISEERSDYMGISGLYLTIRYLDSYNNLIEFGLDENNPTDSIIVNSPRFEIQYIEIFIPATCNDTIYILDPKRQISYVTNRKFKFQITDEYIENSTGNKEWLDSSLLVHGWELAILNQRMNGFSIFSNQEQPSKEILRKNYE